MHLRTKLDSGKFLVLAEMLPPKGVDVSSMVANAERVRGEVDAFVVPEMSNAVMRMSSLGGCMVLKKNGLEAVMQVCCRDRNRLALQADLLAAYALGIAHVMAVTGEKPSYGDHHHARAVNDLDLLELLEGIDGLQSGRDMAGIELTGTPKFMVGSTINAGVSGEPLEQELQEMDRKIKAGAGFFITPPVFDLQTFGGFLKRVNDRGAAIIPTVLLLKSVGMARYIDRNIEHISIPAYIMRRVQKSTDRVRDCVRIAADLVMGLKEVGCSGVLIATIGWEDKIGDILDKAKL